MRHRNMYYLTGLPGFVRFGYSPGWVGRSPSGLGPCAQFLATGQWPFAQAGAIQSPAMAGWPGADPQARLQFLKNQASLLEQQLAALTSQINAIEEEDK